MGEPFKLRALREKRLPALVDVPAELLKTYAKLRRPLMSRASDQHVANCGKASYLKAAHGFQSLCWNAAPISAIRIRPMR